MRFQVRLLYDDASVYLSSTLSQIIWQVNEIYHHMLGQFSKRLREERNRLGLSQEEFAKKADVTKNTQLAYEQGARPPDVLYLYRIADAGVDLFYLLGREGDWAKLAPEIAELIRSFRTLDSTGQALVMGIIVLLAGTSQGSRDSLADTWRTVRLLKRMTQASTEEKAMIERAVDALLGSSGEPSRPARSESDLANPVQS